MQQRAREEDGMGVIELMAAIVVVTVAIMALMAGYDSAFLSLHNAAAKSAASTLADNQLELYSALSYSAIGLDSSTLASVKATNSTYVSDEAGLDNAASATDATITGCGSSSQCLPVQTLTGSDRKSYTVETFIRNIANAVLTGRSERVVTVIVRNPSVSGSPVLVQQTAAFDAGP